MIWLQLYVFVLFNVLLFFTLKKEGAGKVNLEHMVRGIVCSAVIIAVFSFIGYKKLLGYSPAITFIVLVLIPAALWVANKYDPMLFIAKKKYIIYGLAYFFLMIFTLSISIWSSNYDEQLKEVKQKYNIMHEYTGSDNSAVKEAK